MIQWINIYFCEMIPELKRNACGIILYILKSSTVTMQEEMHRYFIIICTCLFQINLRNPTYPVSLQAWLLSWHPPSQNQYLCVPGPGPPAGGTNKRIHGLRTERWQETAQDSGWIHQKEAFSASFLLFCDQPKQQREGMVLLICPLQMQPSAGKQGKKIWGTDIYDLICKVSNALSHIFYFSKEIDEIWTERKN